jgi:hypothetical protein
MYILKMIADTNSKTKCAGITSSSRCNIRQVNYFVVSSCPPNLARSNFKAISGTMSRYLY